MASKNDDILTDDYVAGLLASEAKDCSLKYSALGLEGYNSSSRPSNKSKPNTRFLRHIIKSTTHHNAALLAKEAAESQARLQELAEAEEKKRRKNNPEPRDVRRRQLGDIAAILSGRKPRRDKVESGKGRSSERGEKGESRNGDSSSRSQRRSRDRSRSPHRARGDRKDRRGEAGEERSHGRHKRRHDTSDDEGGHRSSRRRRERSRSPNIRPHKHRQRSPLQQHHSDSDSGTPSGRRHKKRSAGILQDDNEDSDPLEDIIGPSLAPLASVPRGRGAASGSSGIDRRFSASYDPKADVQPDTQPAADDWDDAVEAFRDRQKWKQQGADRLRAAGFTDDQIRKWERSGAENADADLGDFQWTKKGEKREWDRGKTVGDDGETTAEADWSK